MLTALSSAPKETLKVQPVVTMEEPKLAPRRVGSGEGRHIPSPVWVCGLCYSKNYKKKVLTQQTMSDLVHRQGHEAKTHEAENKNEADNSENGTLTFGLETSLASRT